MDLFACDNDKVRTQIILSLANLIYGLGALDLKPRTAHVAAH